MEDSQILELLRKKSPQTTLEVAKAARMSWHVIQEQLLELQIDGKLDRITVGRQNLWFLKGQKWKGLAGMALTNIILLGIVGIMAAFFVFSSIIPNELMQGNASFTFNNTVIEQPDFGNQSADMSVQEDETEAINLTEKTPEEISTIIQQYDWLAYDNTTNTIKIFGNDIACTQANPCTLTHVYNSGLGKIENIYNYFIVNSTIEIESGYFISQFEHIATEKPWIVRKNGHLRFGIIENNRTYGSIFFETYVPEADEINNAALINEGTLEIYDSNYKIFSIAENNLYQTDDAIFRAKRFDMQRINDGNTTLFVPLDSSINDYLRHDYVKIRCAGDCTIGEAYI